MRRITVLGATGSIGQNTLDLIRRDRAGYDVVALAGGRNIDQLARDAVEFDAAFAVTAFDACYDDLKAALSGTSIRVAAGPQALVEAAAMPADWICSAIIGAAGLAPGLAAMGQGTTVALANKESLVCAGPLVMDSARLHGTRLLPVDSEHSAIFQALIGEDMGAVERVIITASGGAFRDWDHDQLAKATPEQAATHPNWDMGQRITIDSASMFNKALELIEAKEFFGFTPNQIETIIHPESLIHALVGFQDGALMAHVGAPDMRHAIGFALNYPNRAPLPVERLDLAKIAQMTFSPACETRHPALRLARVVMENGGLWGAAFNAAKEAALDRFIAHDIGFLDMATVVEKTLEEMDAKGDLPAIPKPDLDQITTCDIAARRIAAGIKCT